VSAVHDTVSLKGCKPIFRLLKQHNHVHIQPKVVQFSSQIQYFSTTNNSDTDFCTSVQFGLCLYSWPVDRQCVMATVSVVLYMPIYSNERNDGGEGKCLPEFILQELATLTFTNNNFKNLMSLGSLILIY